MSGRASTVASVLLGVGACAACAPEPGAGAAEVRVVDLEQLAAALAEVHKPLLVNFWATWCQPCIAELPDLVTVAPGFIAQGGAVLGVALDTTAPGYELNRVRDALPRFLAERGIGFPTLLYSGTDPIAVSDRLDLPGPIPVTLAFDGSGRRVAVHLGRASRAEFEELAGKALGH